jgi:hypothetical protein
MPSRSLPIFSRVAPSSDEADGQRFHAVARLCTGVVKVTGFTAAQGDTPFVTEALRGKCAPLRQCHRASLLVNLPGDEMPLLIEMVVDLGVN